MELLIFIQGTLLPVVSRLKKTQQQTTNKQNPTEVI